MKKKILHVSDFSRTVKLFSTQIFGSYILKKRLIKICENKNILFKSNLDNFELLYYLDCP